MKRNALILVAVIVAVALIIYFGARISRSPSAQAGTMPMPTSTVAAAGKQAPDFTLQTLDGKSVKLSDYRGKAVLLNFWATWCAPCKIEMPWFVDFYKKYQPQGFEIVGVAMDDSGKDEIAKFTKEMGVNYTILQGKDAVGDSYGGVQFLPSSFYIDRNGKITDVVYGIRSKSDLETDIKKALTQ